MSGESCEMCYFYEPDENKLTSDEWDEVFNDVEADGWCCYKTYPVPSNGSCWRYKDDPTQV